MSAVPRSAAFRRDRNRLQQAARSARRVVARRVARALAASLVVGIVASSACARVGLRQAMGRVQRARVALDDRIEARRLDELPAALDALDSALHDPRIARSTVHRTDPRFEELLVAARVSVDEFRELTRVETADDLLLSRGVIDRACVACHDDYRRP